MKKCHLKHIRAWYEDYREPPVDAIRGNRDHYAGLWIRPWYGLKRKNPPLPVFQEMLDAFSRMYDQWEKAFREAGQPFDLQLWVYDEHMIDSQLVCAGVENHGDRRTNYFHDCPEQYKFQYEKYKKGTDFDPNDFEWVTYEVRAYLFEKEDHLSERRIRRLLKNGWREDNQLLNGRERAFCHIYDFVWVGRKS